jgi:hypothetical protein
LKTETSEEMEMASTRIRATMRGTPLTSFLSEARRFAYPVNLVRFIVSLGLGAHPSPG